MNKLLIFDIDGTLCDINKPVDSKLVKTLQDISEKYQIVLASGKPFGYIAGFIRQLGLSNCIIIGENGATIMYSATFPPKSYYQIEINDSIEKLFLEIKQQFSKKFKQSIWFQPNAVNLTVFPIDIKDIEKIHQFAQKFENNKINTYYHKDSVDFTPKGFDKGIAVDILLNKLNYSPENLYIFGDGSNDLPMLKKTKNSFLVNFKIENFEPKKYFNNYKELEIYLRNKFLNIELGSRQFKMSIEH